MKKIILICFLMFVAGKAFPQEVYVLNQQSQFEQVNPAVVLGIKTHANLLAAYGAKMKQNIQIDGETSNLILPCGAVNFYLENPETKPIQGWTISRLEKGKKKTRELPYMKTGGFSGSKIEIKKIPLKYEKIAKGIYHITPMSPLPEGEYCLFIPGVGQTDFPIYTFRTSMNLSPALTFPEKQDILALFKDDGDNIMEGERDRMNYDSDISDNKRLVATKLESDVDINIPQTKNVSENTFALIVSNENYKQVEKVPYAINDGKVFEKYLELTLGIPAKHIVRVEDASLSDMKFAINRINEIADVYDGDMKLIVYYSGHGIPDESSKESYILPVDGYATDVSTAYKLSSFYSDLEKLKTKTSVLFMDACFSGAQRNGAMLVSARGVAIKPKTETLSGNLIVFSAAQGDQTAYPYKEKEHGLMTYFLLKKIQDSKGNVNLGELNDYISKEVKKTSIVENGKLQTPSVIVNPNNKNWEKVTLK